MSIPNHILRPLSLLVFCLAPLSASAQFFTTGDDPHSIRWKQIETKTYQIIYPQGLDSLAKVYARKLESKQPLVGTNAAYLPGEAYRKKTPVILHSETSASNGIVTWAPQRMELYTTPEAYNPTPLPWEDDLAAHESRHVGQMQFGNSRALKPFNWFFGEMFSGFCAGLYIGKDYLEGDAVIAETALSNSGRGRTADFLNYYMIAQDQGKGRKWYAWRNGSQHNYTPNHYAIGYLYWSGLRYFYSDSLAVANVLRRASLRPYDFTVTNNITKKLTGLSRKEAFDTIIDKTYDIWKANLADRQVETRSHQAVKTPKLYNNYFSNVILNDGTVYSILKSLERTARLVKTDSNGTQSTICNMASSTSRLKLCNATGRIWWSENLQDTRWEHRSQSAIYYLDLASQKCHRLTKKGKFFNPCPSPDGKTVACVHYPSEGGSSVCLIDAENGKTICETAAPDGLQAVELAWLDDKLYVSGITSKGFGIYQVPSTASRNWLCCLQPEPVTIRNLDAKQGSLFFFSDRNGVNEYYSFNPAEKSLLQKTSTRYGASEFAMSENGRWLCFSKEGLEGKLLHRIEPDSLLCRTVDFSQHYKYPVAEALSRQDRNSFPSEIPNEDSISISESKPYRKLPHLIRPHSWAPLYVDAASIMEQDFSNALSLVSPGVMLFSQNTLGTAISSIGYSYHRDRANNSGWRHSGHLLLSYSGLYPVFQFSLDFNDRAAYDYSVEKFNFPSEQKYESKTTLSSRPYLTGKLKVYIPLNFSSGAWSRAVSPGVSWSFSNDSFDVNPLTWTAVSNMTGNEIMLWSLQTSEHDIRPIQTINTYVKAYTMQNVASSAVYPRFGIGTELGLYMYPGMNSLYSPDVYGYLYGYLPGVVAQQGLRLSALGQMPLDNGSVFRTAAANTLPRGFSNKTLLLSQLGSQYPYNCKFTADYAIPVWLGDLNIFGGAFYVKRMVLTPHFDFSCFGRENLWSAGSNVRFDFGTILWLKYSVQAGVSISYNSGSLFNPLVESGTKLERVFLAPTFSVSF